MNSLLSLAGGQLGKLSEHLEELNRPESEGGQLKEGWERITYLITTHGDQVVLSLVPLCRNEEGQLLLEKPLRNLSLEDLFNAQSNDGDENSAD